MRYLTLLGHRAIQGGLLLLLRSNQTFEGLDSEKPGTIRTMLLCGSKCIPPLG